MGSHSILEYKFEASARDAGYSVVCFYDFMGKRTDRLEYHGNTLTSREHFIYKGYVQIAAYKLDEEGESGDCFVLSKSCYWDPSQPTATRILAMKDATDATMLYAACDTVKNITALYDDAGTCRARYVYSPYGEKLIEEGDKHTANAFGFSSEYDDSPLGLYYYNYRYLNPNDGRWINRDPIDEQDHWNLYIALANRPFNRVDHIGLWTRMKGEGRENHWCAGKGDTLKHLASKYDASEEDWQCLWPVGETPNHGYPNNIEPGDVYDASNLVASQEGKDIQYILSYDLIPDYAGIFPSAEYVNPITVPLLLETISKEGQDPISNFVSAGHGGYGGYSGYGNRGTWNQYSVQDLLDRSHSATFERAKQRKGPIRCWFTRKAQARFSGCSSQEIARPFAEQILRKGAISYGTDRSIGTSSFNGILRLYYNYIQTGTYADGSPIFYWDKVSKYMTSPVWKKFEGKL